VSTWCQPGLDLHRHTAAVGDEAGVADGLDEILAVVEQVEFEKKT
jgi:hypothetical protein